MSKKKFKISLDVEWTKQVTYILTRKQAIDNNLFIEWVNSK